MSVRIWQGLAVGCLALAIGAVLGSVRSTLRAGEIQGPSALVVVPAGEVWIGVDSELWRLSPQGALIEAKAVGAAGLPGPPANLVRGPEGAIVASVRHDATLYFLDPASAQVTRRLLPQWPADLARHGGRAINFAFDTQGRVAVATGGGDAVALFDAAGRFIARSAPGAYAFTNGLWWTDEGLWTTDTNRFTLRLLDASSLQERRAVTLGEGAVASFLGPARGRPGSPMAALIRYRGDMTEGNVAQVGADARATDLPQVATMEPRDVDWLGDDILAVDGASFSVLRWSAARRATAPFGDDAVRSRLAALTQQRDLLRSRYAQWLVAAGVALVAGLACAAMASMAARPKRSASPLDLSRLGTPRASRKVVLRQQLALYGGIALAWMPLMALSLVPITWLKTGLGDRAVWVMLGMTVVLLLSMLAAVPFLARRIKRLSRLPEYESTLNFMAMRLLDRQSAMVAAHLRGGEQVLETFVVNPGMKWHLLTTQRLLVLRASLFGHAPAAAHELGDVSAVATMPGAAVPASRWKPALQREAWLEIAIDGAAPISGSVGSPVLAARVAQRMGALSAQWRPLRAARPAGGPGVPAFDRARRWHRTVASFLLPGLGQWQQRRTGEAIVFIVVWTATLIFFTGPMLWTLVEPFAGVGWAYAGGVTAWHAMLSALAAADAWHGESAPARDP
jgi:hypothetical protein